MHWSHEYMFVGKKVVILWTTQCTSASVALQSAKHSRYSSINVNCCKVWAKEISTDSWAFIVFTNALTYLHLEIFQSFYNLVILILHLGALQLTCQICWMIWYHSLYGAREPILYCTVHDPPVDQKTYQDWWYNIYMQRQSMESNTSQ